MDCEWKPFGPARPSVMQLASKNYSVILDIKMLLGSHEFQKFIRTLMTSSTILKVGHSYMKNDFKFLIAAYHLPCFSQAVNFVDIDVIHYRKYKGRPMSSLKFLTAAYLRIAIEQK